MLQLYILSIQQDDWLKSFFIGKRTPSKRTFGSTNYDTALIIFSSPFSCFVLYHSCFGV